jgi:hypothetical protein
MRYGYVFVILLFTIVFLFVYAFILVNNYDYEKICLSHGYPRTAYASGEPYCIKTENGTDVVMPARELRQYDNTAKTH